jgi:putative membrane protein
MTTEVANQIYQALRYTQAEDGTVTDGALYTSLYDGAFSSNAASTVYGIVVRQVLLTAAGQPADSQLSADQLAQAIKTSYAKGAQAGDATATAMYAVTNGMSSAQLAELLYAKSGAKDTLFAMTQTQIQTQLSAGRDNEQIQAAVESSLQTLSTQLAGACQTVAEQAAGSGAISGAESAKAEVASQIEAVQSNGYSLVTGAAALAKGTQSLADQVPTLTEGIKALNDATVKIVDGVDELDDGSHELSDGMTEFDEKGISKIVNSYNGDIKPLADRLQATLDAGADYQTFTALADGVNGSVKFIYKMDAIKADD